MKAVIGMSGGVDSSVAAWLMLKEVDDLQGVTLKLTCDIITKNDLVIDSTCCSADDIIRAKENCDQFHIPHHVLNFSTSFKEKIVDTFAEAYFSGITPNPCILCNREIKWTDLLNWMDTQNIDFLATGHYARINFNEKSQRYELLRAKDLTKDQSYVLWALNQKQLTRTRFPLGELTKSEVRNIAAGLKLSNADKADSQDICFVPDNNYRNFLQAYDEKRTQNIGPGNFIDTEGRILGQHRGYYRYTIGQRRGLNLAMGYPVYVKTIDPVKNEVTVVEKKDLLTAGCLLKSVNWISEDGQKNQYDVQIKIRYRHKGIQAQLYPLNSKKIVVNFEDSADSVTPGQSAVFYDGDRVLGGGIIEKALEKPEDVEACRKSQ